MNVEKNVNEKAVKNETPNAWKTGVGHKAKSVAPRGRKTQTRRQRNQER